MFAFDLDGVAMAKLRGAIALPRPDTAITVLNIYTHDHAPPRRPRAWFETEVFETGPGYRRNRVGRCETAQGQWTCDGRDRLLLDSGVRAGVPTTMPTAQALHILDFAMPLAKQEQRFSLNAESDGKFAVNVSDAQDCHWTIWLQRKGEILERVHPHPVSAKACI